MNESKKYNGWTDRPTWAVNLWISDQQWISERMDGLAGRDWSPQVGSAIRMLAILAGVLADITREELAQANVKEVYDIRRLDLFGRCPGCGEPGPPHENSSCVTTEEENTDAR
jgi:hypothetical protein